MDLIEAGSHVARAGSASLRTSSTGKEYVAVMFTLKDKRVVREDFYLTDAAWEYSLPKLRACGWVGDDIGDLTSICEEVEILIKHEQEKTREGAPKLNKDGTPLIRARVERVRALGGTEMGDEQKKSFVDKIRSRLSTMPDKPAAASPAPAPAAPRAQPPRQIAPTRVADEDVPF